MNVFTDNVVCYAALIYWWIPSAVFGALPLILELCRRKKLPPNRIKPVWFYLGVIALVPVTTLPTIAIAFLIDGGWLVPVILGLVIVVLAAWIIRYSRPRSFDPFLGVWVACNTICVMIFAFNVANPPTDTSFFGLEYVLVWAWIGLPLVVVALIYVVTSRRWHSEAAHETPDSVHAHPAAEQ
ncbi:hypothetical protein CKALI_10125 [Corynebacterium kalinowskii]|uniref:Uncharacterized protein n=1 Tax=Corynebacterium kalinowskii TaxID=2675216 RepID=A0A6B8VZX3_9CORY|nr:hypothetical protein [Corynebacterium kalinowskii]QGU02880.1 hypothetical protein CKALI_10125 [Corynebacterium kalinowskii]